MTHLELRTLKFLILYNLTNYESLLQKKKCLWWGLTDTLAYGYYDNSLDLYNIMSIL